MADHYLDFKLSRSVGILRFSASTPWLASFCRHLWSTPRSRKLQDRPHCPLTQGHDLGVAREFLPPVYNSECLIFIQQMKSQAAVLERPFTVGWQTQGLAIQFVFVKRLTVDYIN
jgi:hypothetical protein